MCNLGLVRLPFWTNENTSTGNTVCHACLPGSALAGYYGAIAFSQDSGANGRSWNFETKWQAKNRALRECSKHGRGCKVVLWFRNACGALAISPGNGYGASWDSDEYAARRSALRTCYKYNDTCSIKASYCSN